MQILARAFFLQHTLEVDGIVEQNMMWPLSHLRVNIYEPAFHKSKVYAREIQNKSLQYLNSISNLKH